MSCLVTAIPNFWLVCGLYIVWVCYRELEADYASGHDWNELPLVMAIEHVYNIERFRP